MKTFLKYFLAIVLSAGIAGGGTWYYFNNKFESEKTTLDNQIADLNKKVADLESAATATSSTTTTDTATDKTADWKTYTNSTYGFSFKYPSDWVVSGKDENFNDARKYEIDMNFSNGLATNTSYVAEVFASGNMTAKQFVDSWYGGVEGGPSYITDGTVNSLPVVKFFMEKAHIGGPAGSAYIMFNKNSNAVSISTGGRTISSGSVSDFYNTIKTDTILNQIASTFQFTK